MLISKASKQFQAYLEIVLQDDGLHTVGHVMYLYKTGFGTLLAVNFCIMWHASCILWQRDVHVQLHWCIFLQMCAATWALPVSVQYIGQVS